MIVRLSAGLLAAALLVTGCGGGEQKASTSSAKVGLITKTETNPFFVKMKEGAQTAAKEDGAKLLTAAGKFDGDNAGQVTAIENMITAGAKGILITPERLQGDRARDQEGPRHGRDGHRAGHADRAAERGRRAVRHRQLQGRRADRRVRQGRRWPARPPKIATLDLRPGIPVGVQRHNGFLKGFGDHRARRPVRSSASAATRSGDQAKGQTAMENCLQKDPDINLVYTINEPAAARRLHRAEGGGQGEGRHDRLGRRRLHRRQGASRPARSPRPRSSTR